MVHLLAYLRLVRLPNVFTAMADVIMGFVFVQDRTAAPSLVLVCLIGASSLLYMAGMVLNDVYDIEVDARQRPFRPLPSGQISFGWAKWLGYEMLLVGVAIATVAGFLYPADISIVWRSGVVALVLAICVVIYDAILKTTPIGPLAMGACRFFNVLLGMSVAAVATDSPWTIGYATSELMVAAGIGTYIAGVSWFARSEAAVSSRAQLVFGILVMSIGIGLLATYGDWGDQPWRMAIRPPFMWPLLLVLLAITIVRRCLWAVIDPTPQRVQAAVKQCILSLIVLDAAVCLAVRPHESYWAILVLALLVPTLVLGRWVYST